MTDKTPTERLRVLLDERGVEYYYPHEYGGMVKWSDGTLTYHAGNAFPCNDPTRTKLVMHVVYPTPEQAVEVTLGRGECSNDSLKRGVGVFVCSECGAYLDIIDMREEDIDVFYEPRYCPNCGRRVVEEL